MLLNILWIAAHFVMSFFSRFPCCYYHSKTIRNLTIWSDVKAVHVVKSALRIYNCWFNEQPDSDDHVVTVSRLGVAIWNFVWIFFFFLFQIKSIYFFLQIVWCFPLNWSLWKCFHAASYALSYLFFCRIRSVHLWLWISQRKLNFGLVSVHSFPSLFCFSVSRALTQTQTAARDNDTFSMFG